MPVISIIVPIYNVEKFLPRCIDSILVQTFVDFECILVDDGSTDNSLEICMEYSGKDQRIIVIHQSNTGTAHARHTGINNAIGECIVFVDGDDWIENNLLYFLYKKQQETDADIVVCGIRQIFPNKKKQYIFSRIESKQNYLSYIYLNTFGRVMWGRIYKKSLFDNYYVPYTNVGEDAIVNIQIFSKLSPGKLQKIDNVLYNYDWRTFGVTQKKQDNYYHSYMDVPYIKSYLWIDHYLNEIKGGGAIRPIIYNYMIKMYIVPYLKHNKIVSKNEICIFYNHYYRTASRYPRIKLINKIIIPLYYYYPFFGKSYIYILNIISKFNNIILSILSKE